MKNCKNCYYYDNCKENKERCKYYDPLQGFEHIAEREYEESLKERVDEYNELVKEQQS